MREELTREEFIAQRPQRQCDYENHCSWGVILLWEEAGKQYQEYQPDIGPVTFYVADIPERYRPHR